MKGEKGGEEGPMVGEKGWVEPRGVRVRRGSRILLILVWVTATTMAFAYTYRAHAMIPCVRACRERYTLVVPLLQTRGWGAGNKGMAISYRDLLFDALTKWNGGSS